MASSPMSVVQTLAGTFHLRSRPRFGCFPVNDLPKMHEQSHICSPLPPYNKKSKYAAQFCSWLCRHRICLLDIHFFSDSALRVRCLVNHSQSTEPVCLLAEPFLARRGMYGRMLPPTSEARTLRASCGSSCFQFSLPRTHSAPSTPAKTAPPKPMSALGGKDFFSGTLEGSNTFTLGVSFASCTFAISYSRVRVSNTASSTLVCRYKSA